MASVKFSYDKSIKIFKWLKTISEIKIVNKKIDLLYFDQKFIIFKSFDLMYVFLNIRCIKVNHNEQFLMSLIFLLYIIY